MNIINYSIDWRDKVAEFFIKMLERHPDYISHGEIQMGIAHSDGRLSHEALSRWKEYLDRQSANQDAIILLVLDEDMLIGFIIAGYESDSYEHYGVIYDMCVEPESRGSGIGSEIIGIVFDRMMENGVASCYLESGLNNHRAHHFFEKIGFKVVSKIFAKDL